MDILLQLILYFSLFWITPYAIATASRRGWLTRDLPKKLDL